MIIVIADDITGAAEMAGISCSYGFKTELVVSTDVAMPPCDVLVIATDTRSMTVEEAVSYTRTLAKRISQEQAKRKEEILLFKKTDSAMRGHVMAELAALLSETQYKQALWIPANPSKGRTIHHGMYYIDGKPISETDFSFDPEFPALSSCIAERFPQASDIKVQIPDATCRADINNSVKGLSEDALPAGAADFFSAWIEGMGHRHVVPRTFDMPNNNVIVVCGSTQSQPSSWDMEISNMPLEVYDGVSNATTWSSNAEAIYKKHHAIVLAIAHRHLTGREVAVRLRHETAIVVSRLVAIHRPAELVIEGGATAYSCLKEIGWQKFQVIGEVAPGVVRMTAPGGTVITLKPGSYKWGHTQSHSTNSILQ